MKQSLLITGSSGFLGSALSAALARRFCVTGLDLRSPSGRLLKTAPGAVWNEGDIADADVVESVFRQACNRGCPIDCILHFAAFTGFEESWHDRYERSNLTGTRTIMEAALTHRVKRVLFAGSIAAFEPDPTGRPLTETSPVAGDIAYTRSKALGEAILREYSDRVPSVVLRLGGVFTDWCELPPLFSLIRLWSSPLTGNLIAGRGRSGFPYIHRMDVVRAVEAVLERHEGLEDFETLLISESGCTCQDQLYPEIRKALGRRPSMGPVHVPARLTWLALQARQTLNRLQGQKTYEQPWMIRYVDRPIRVDTTRTRKILDWEPASTLGILERIPIIVNRFRRFGLAWYLRNIRRNEQEYVYEPDTDC